MDLSRTPRLLPSAVLLALLAGCMVGPDYHRPSAPTPVAFKEAAGWKAARPADAVAKGDWWKLYGDLRLDSLMAQVNLSNQTVAQYGAQYREAQALVRETRAGLLPTVTGSFSSTRSQTGSGSGSSSQTGSSAQGEAGNSHSASVSASWELDLWGKLRRGVERDSASAEASAADLANALLSARSELAQAYFKLRVADLQIDLYGKTVQAYTRYVAVTQNKYDAQISSRADLAQAQNQLESARASLLASQWARAQYEHAIALLVGKAPADFSLAADLNWRYVVPSIPVGVPTALLERRPDIAAAEREMAAANASVGVAVAAYYPDLTLDVSGGYQGSSISHLVNVPNRFWSIGPSFSGTLLDFGATRASVEQYRASYDAQVALYRQTVLTALGEVEDYLVQLRTQEPQLAALERAVAAAAESARVTYDQYEAGKIDYLDVATTQATLLSQRQSLLSLTSTQMVTSVQLIAALGGSWE
ncbi:efflux transporter outer membrane subunit [Pseudomonas citronellolis]|uniref:efflux transporter outer membrane subunit n=1 Tax=Pseudomonas citronellolis TaxID=53408 RepID=UPI002FDAB5A4